MPQLKEKQNIPSGWFETTLETECDFFKGQSLAKSDIDSSGKNKCILYGQLFTTYSEVIKDIKSRTNSDKGVVSRKGDVLVPASTTTVAKDLAIASALLEDNVLLGGDINVIRGKKNSYDPKFLAYYLTHYKNKDLSNYAQGVTIIHLSGTKFKEMSICIPKSVSEQEKIAEILSIVDEDIEKTKATIKTTEKLKRGLMQELFTRGIGHTKFQQTKNGEIPLEWNFELLDSVSKRGSGHTPNKQIPEYYNGGIKWISLADSKLLDHGEISKTKINISVEGISNSSAVLHPKGTVLLYRDAGVGKSAVMAETMAVSQHFITWTCSEKLNNWYLYYYLQLQKSVFERIAVGSTIKTIGLEFFRKYKVPVAPITEQQKIADMLLAVDEKISINKKLLAKQTELKKGLMQDLLSGNKRISI